MAQDVRAFGGSVIGSKPVKHSVALVVRRGSDVDSDLLLVRRPDDDDEFPGMWGLPAASCRDGEDEMEAAQRIATLKLGTRIEICATLGKGSQERPSYVIEMTLLEGFLTAGSPVRLPSGGTGSQSDGVTVYTAYRWGQATDLSNSAAGGSLCSQLLLISRGLRW
ncbi:MAG: NUDIX hydrolase [Chloroflexi bacterium]|nr:NUDIX hydrolase [Chloroflexota bacterium]MDA1227214.1 NUDIX hydrolase [Chloroflexota bacterium]